MSIFDQLEKRNLNGSYRKLQKGKTDLIDFSSNDYLGLARSSQLKNQILNVYTDQQSKNGSTGSRLLTGNSDAIEKLESRLASLFQFEASTLFSSGFMANLSLFSTIPQKGDTVIYDELSHACIKDGIRLSLAKRFPFKHSDLNDLSQKLGKAEGNVFVACESVYSMDGDLAPLAELTKICEDHGAHLIIDEAHSTGIWGEKGQGLSYELNLENKVFAVVHTFGKAMGIHGATISGSKLLKEALINFARPFIYTTAPSDHEVCSVDQAFSFLGSHPSLQANLFHKIGLFNELNPNYANESAIKSVIIGGNEKTKAASERLTELGYDIRPILSPTVTEGSERLRICLHSFNTEKDIINLSQHLKDLVK